MAHGLSDHERSQHHTALNAGTVVGSDVKTAMILL
jgi:hypothetical protein